MGERTVTMQGKPLALCGKEMKVGEKAPDFEVQDTDLKPLKLSTSQGKVTLILSVPSLDTSVCSKETHTFNERVKKYGNQIEVLTISMDLPFAQKKWCGTEGAMNLKVASDHMRADFGEKYGVLIEDLRLLARCVFLIDEKGVLRYIHLVKEITHEPPYDEIFSQLTALLQGVK